MPYTTCVAGTVITAAWANANIRDQAVTPFADAAARDTAITTPVEGMVAYLRDVDYLTVYLGSIWIAVGQPFSATVATSETTTSTSYTDLATSGPAVTVDTGTKALVTLGASGKCSAADSVRMGFAVSGASTVAAADAQSLLWVGTNEYAFGASFMVTGLTAGSNVFTAKYKIGFSGTATFSNRNITVTGMS